MLLHGEEDSFAREEISFGDFTLCQYTEESVVSTLEVIESLSTIFRFDAKEIRRLQESDVKFY